MSSTFSAEPILQLKTQISLLEVIGQHVVLKKTGSLYVGLCPFHAEKTPSFQVHPIKQFYYCFGCQKSGDVINFVMETQGLSFLQAIEQLALQYQLQLPEGLKKAFKASASAPESLQQDLHYKLNRFVLQFYQDALLQSVPAQDFCQQRGLTSAMIETFCIGYAPDTWDGLYQYLTQTQAPLETALELGLLKSKTQQAGLRDHFVHRLIFPLINAEGKVAGFSGRALGNEPPKYINSMESDIFYKSAFLFGYYQAKKHIREKNTVIVVEGYTDMIAMYYHGYPYTVATCGTSFSVHHLKSLRKIAKKIIILFDADEAGQQAMYKAMYIGLEHHVMLYGAILSQGKDPHEVLLAQPDTFGTSVMDQAMAEAQPIIDLRLRYIVQKYLALEATPGLQTECIEQAAQLMLFLKQPLEYQWRKSMLLKRCGFSEGVWKAAINAANRQKNISKKGLTLLPSDVPVVASDKMPSAMDLAILESIIEQGARYAIVKAYAQGIGDILGRPFEIKYFLESSVAKTFYDYFCKDDQILATLQDPLVAFATEAAQEPAIRALLAKLLSQDPRLGSLSSFERALWMRKNYLIDAKLIRMLSADLALLAPEGKMVQLDRMMQLKKLSYTYQQKLQEKAP